MSEPAHQPVPAPASLYGMPVIGAGETVSSIGAALTGAVLAPVGRRWRLAVAGALALVLVWAGLRPAVPAALAAAGAGWWIGLASGCLLISGLLLLADVAWRCGIARLAQTAALLGAGLAALHPAPLHGVSLTALFAAAGGLWAAALLPDLAVLRDRLAAGPERRRARVYRALSAVWRGSAVQWLAWERACRGFGLLGILAAVAALIDLALAAALHSDRHDTLLPVALLVEAVLSGAGLIATLAVALRRSLGLDGLVTGRHLDILGRLILAFGLAALYCHVTEIVTALLYGDAAERARLIRRLLGDEAPAFWTLMLAGLLPTQLFWIASLRRGAVLGLIGALAAAGLGADHVLAARAGANGADLAAALSAAIGSAGLFVLGLLLLFRLVPPVSIAETRRLALGQNPHAAQRSPEPGPAEGPHPSSGQGARPGLMAVFASEAELAEAVRGLSGPDTPSRLDAFGPAPMPEAAAALHARGHSLNRVALSGALLGATVFLVARAAGLGEAVPEGLAGMTALASPASWPTPWANSWSNSWPIASPLSWALAAVPALAAAVLGGTLGLGIALGAALARARGDVSPALAPAAALAGRFLLTIEPADAPFRPAALVRRLETLPEAAGRPLALYGPSAPERPL